VGALGVLCVILHIYRSLLQKRPIKETIFFGGCLGCVMCEYIYICANIYRSLLQKRPIKETIFLGVWLGCVMCEYIYVCANIYICAYIYMYMCKYIYMYICALGVLCVNIYMYIYMYICAYIYMYICAISHMTHPSHTPRNIVSFIGLFCKRDL